LFEKKLGDPVTLRYAERAAHVPIAAIVMDYSSIRDDLDWTGASISRTGRTWGRHDRHPPRPKPDRAAISQEIRARLAGKTDRLFVMTASR